MSFYASYLSFYTRTYGVRKLPLIDNRMQREDILIPFFVAALYFAGTFVTVGVIQDPLTAFRSAMVAVIISMLVLLVLRRYELNRLVGIQIALGFSLLIFGLIWWAVRTVLESLDLWPFIDNS